MQSRVCKCGTPFEVPHPSSKKLNCSAKCRGVKTKVRADAGIRKKEWAIEVCACGAHFEAPPGNPWSSRPRRYCSPECAATYRTKGGRPMETPRRVLEDGYVSVYIPPDQRSVWGRSYVKEHRLVMSQILG